MGYRAGHVNAVGSFGGSLSFSNQVVISTGGGVLNAFTAQWSAQGTLDWLQQIGGISTTSQAGNIFGKAIAADAAGNAYAVYQIHNDALFGQTVVSVPANMYTLVVVKYNPQGTILWLNSFNATVSLESGGIAVDAGGTCWLAASFAGQLALGTTRFTSSHSVSQMPDGVLVKLDDTGTVVWSKQIVGGRGNVFTALAADANGNVYAAGHFDNVIAFSPVTGLIGAPDGHLFIAKYDATGNVLWARNMGIQSIDAIAGLAVDATGAIAACGSFGSNLFPTGTATARFGALTLTTEGMQGLSDGFIVHLSTQGTFEWVQALSGPADEYADAIVVGAAGTFYVSGTGNSAMHVGGFPATFGNGDPDGFVAKFNAVGVPQWLTNYGGPDADYFAGTALATDGAGRVYVGGSFHGSAYFGTSSAVSFPNRDAAFVAQLTDNQVLSSKELIATEMALQLYPNPAHEQVQVAWMAAVQPISIEITDILGRPVKRILIRSATVKMTISLAGLQAGVYLIKIVSERFPALPAQRLVVI